MRARRSSHPRLPAVAHAVVDMLRQLGADILEAKVQRRICIVWRIAGRTFRALITSVVPRGEDAAIFAARECNRVRDLCGLKRARPA